MVYAEQFLPSGTTALVLTIEPVWIVFLVWALNRAEIPKRHVWLGIVLGTIGMFILLGSQNEDFDHISLKGFLILLLSTFCWAL